MTDYKKYLNEQYFGSEVNERELLKEMQPYVEAADVFFDLGASFGLYTKFAMQNNNACEVFSYEPDPFRFKELNKNIVEWSEQPGRTAKAIPKAVYDQKMVVKFHTDSTNISGALGETKKHESSIEISTEVLDQQYSYQNKRIVFKIDVEGAEFRALQGAERLLRNNSVVIMLEVHKWGDLLNGGGKPGQVLWYLFCRGFGCRKILGRYILEKNGGSRTALGFYLAKERLKEVLRSIHVLPN